MDLRASLEQLETAARILLVRFCCSLLRLSLLVLRLIIIDHCVFQAAPNVVSKEERSSAENIILTFRKTRNAFVFCKFILENSQTELVVFETADVLRNNLVQDWSKIPPEDIQLINNHILGLLFASTGFSYSIQRRLAGVVALIVKHQSLINNGKQRTDLISHILSNILNASGHELVSYYKPEPSYLANFDLPSC